MKAILKEFPNLFNQSFSWVVLVFILIMGILFCFHGYRFLKFLIGTLFIGTLLAGAYYGLRLHSSLTWRDITIILVVVAFLLLFAIKSLLRFSTFLLGFLGGFFAIPIILEILPLRNDEWPYYATWILGPFILGALTVLFKKPIIVLLSSSLGGALICYSGLLFAVSVGWFELRSSTANIDYVLCGLLVFLGLVGCYCQLSSPKKESLT
mgnify:CR=1 FL=1